MGPRALLVAVAIVVAAVPVASGHERPVRRQVLLSVEAGRTDLLVTYDVRPGQLADRLRDSIDLNRDGAANSGWERLAQAQVLLPRVRRGIRLDVGGRPVELAVSDFRFRNGLREGRRRGLTGMVRYCLPAGWTDDEQAITVGLRDPDQSISVEMQAADGIEVIDAPTVVRADDPVVGPVVLGHAERATFRVRRSDRAGPPAGCPARGRR